MIGKRYSHFTEPAVQKGLTGLSQDRQKIQEPGVGLLLPHRSPYPNPLCTPTSHCSSPPTQQQCEEVFGDAHPSPLRLSCPPGAQGCPDSGCISHPQLPIPSVLGEADGKRHFARSCGEGKASLPLGSREKPWGLAGGCKATASVQQHGTPPRGLSSVP